MKGQVLSFYHIYNMSCNFYIFVSVLCKLMT